MSTEGILVGEVILPQGVTASFKEEVLTIKGPLGENKKDFSRIKAVMKVSGDKVMAYGLTKRRDAKAIANAGLSHVKNMVQGVVNGYTYRMKVVFAHFPITVKVKGKEIHIENFYGERSPRIARIFGSCTAKVEGDDLIITGTSKEDVGQTAAEIEQVTAVKRKDQRVFLDGIYIYEKGVAKA